MRGDVLFFSLVLFFCGSPRRLELGLLDCVQGAATGGRNEAIEAPFLLKGFVLDSSLR